MKAFFSKVLDYWKALGHLIGIVMTPIQMFLVYVVAFGLFGVLMRLAGKDPLDRKLRPEPSFWRKKEKHDPTLEYLRHTF